MPWPLHVRPSDHDSFFAYSCTMHLNTCVFVLFIATGAQLVTTPLDVVRNRLMAGKDKTSKEPSSDTIDQDAGGYLDMLTTLAREEGISGLFAGAAPRVGKAVLSGAIQFATYEETKQTISKMLQR